MNRPREAAIAIQEAIRVRISLAIGLQDLLQSKTTCEALVASLKETEREARRLALRNATQAVLTNDPAVDQCSVVQAEMNSAFRNLSDNLAAISQQIHMIMTLAATVDQIIGCVQGRMEEARVE